MKFATWVIALATAGIFVLSTAAYFAPRAPDASPTPATATVTPATTVTPVPPRDGSGLVVRLHNITPYDELGELVCDFQGVTAAVTNSTCRFRAVAPTFRHDRLEVRALVQGFGEVFAGGKPIVAGIQNEDDFEPHAPRAETRNGRPELEFNYRNGAWFLEAAVTNFEHSERNVTFRCPQLEEEAPNARRLGARETARLTCGRWWLPERPPEITWWVESEYDRLRATDYGKCRSEALSRLGPRPCEETLR